MSGFLKSLFGSNEGAEESAGGAIAAPVSHAEPMAGPIHVTDDTFEELVLKAPLPVMVDFWAPWCGPCRMVAPVVEDLAKNYGDRAVIAKVNTDENIKVAGQLGIMGIPTMILFKDGQEVDRVVGFAPPRTLEQKLQAVLD